MERKVRLVQRSGKESEFDRIVEKCRKRIFGEIEDLFEPFQRTIEVKRERKRKEKRKQNVIEK